MATPSSTNSVALDRIAARRYLPLMPRRILWVGVAIALVAFSSIFAEVRVGVLLRPATAVAVWKFLAGLFPPDLSADFLRIVLRATTQTMAMALASTLLSIAFALPFGILATATLWNRTGLLAGEVHSFAFGLGAVSSRLARALLGFVRAVPDLVWGLLFVAAVGLGALAGTLALAVAYSGVLGRVYADVFEHVDPQPLEALQSTGATRMQIFLRGIWPQALPHLTAYTLYSFECCVRAAAVLGFVGAGGIGYEISISMRLFEYGQVLTLLLVFILLLTVTDAASRYLRARSVNNAQRVRKVKAQANASALMQLIRTSGRLALRILVLPLLIGSFALAGFTPHTLSQAGIATSLVKFVLRMLPPDLTWSFLSSLGTALLQTIAISLLGTLIGVGLAVVLAVPATSTLAFVPGDSPGRRRVIDRVLRWLLFWSTRLVLNILRSIPELVWVLICILAVGIGPFAGTIALGLHTAGVLGKLYAETMEEVPLWPVEALRSLGARPLQLLVWAIWPQARPLLSSYTVLRWEMNLRAATILGLVGGGGLGQAIYNNVQLGFYSRLSTLILVIYALVLASDWIGERLRVGVA
ncbi:MAG TPA: phosphonate ABC transporter, permease protein PhnE [Candidatus Eremiobacteraceae bacterium]|nr:phosphonate ABC transporter, permease protein PhnE [Candidatus Eremiobacteraceae bacterium]